MFSFLLRFHITLVFGKKHTLEASFPACTQTQVIYLFLKLFFFSFWLSTLLTQNTFSLGTNITWLLFCRSYSKRLADLRTIFIHAWWDVFALLGMYASETILKKEIKMSPVFFPALQ